METNLPIKELVGYLERLHREMINDPNVKSAKITDDNYYLYLMPHYLNKFRALRENDKI